MWSKVYKYFQHVCSLLQSRDPSSKMTTEFFALPGLHHASPSSDVSAKVFDDERDSRQMCTDAWGSSSCVDEESDLSSGSYFLRFDLILSV